MRKSIFGVALGAALTLAFIGLGPTISYAAPPQVKVGASEPFQYSYVCDPGLPNSTCDDTWNLNLPVIESGKRLVINHVSVYVSGPGSEGPNAQEEYQPYADLDIGWDTPATEVIYFFPLTKVYYSQTGQVFVGNHEVLAYADSDHPARIRLAGGWLGNPFSFRIAVSGFLEPL